jgi:DNA sulfur modification protein DndE
MSFTRLWVGRQTDSQLRSLAKLGVRPNLICRIAFCLSLRETAIPDPALYDDGQVREFNRSTLFGQWDSLFICLLKEYQRKHKLDPDCDLEEHFRAHICRGVKLLSTRLNELSDLGEILKSTKPTAPHSKGKGNG